MLSCTQINVRSADGLALQGCLWQPPERSRALVWLSHGYAEHIRRYAHVIQPLLDRGFSVAGLDHRGHGDSEGPRALMPRFDVLVRDFHTFVEHVDRIIAPELARFMLAHSMGAVIGLHYTLANLSKLQGLVLSGTAVRLHGINFDRLDGVLSCLAKVRPSLPLKRLDPEILTRDELMVRQFVNDKKCYHGRARAGTAYHLLLAGREALERARDLALPMLVMYGAADTLADPCGSTLLYARSVSKDKELVEWPDCRHEILNELVEDRDKVIKTATAWLNKRA